MNLKANLIAYWKLNDDADNPTIKDAVGENDGDYKDSGGYIDTSTGSVSGKVGKAMFFDGGDEYADFGNDESLLAIKKGWNKYSANPILSTAGDTFTSVFKDGSTYYAWSGSSSTIYRHTSTDGKNWGSRTACTGLTNASVPSVWKEGATWHMMYRKGGGTYTVINYATSSDGLAWTDQGTKISQGGVGEWDYNQHLDPWGIIKIGSTYYLWYNTIGGVRKLGLAFATNLNGSWTKDSNNPIFSGGRFCAWCFKYGDYYYLAVPHYTSGSTPDDHAEIELYRDSNPTFYSNDREFVRILATVARETTWDDEELDTPCILTDTIRRNSYAASNDELWMYYAGETGTTWKTGMAIETDPPSALTKRGLTVVFWMKHSLTYNGRRIIACGSTGTKYGWGVQNRTPDGFGEGNLAFGSSQGHIETRLSAENDFNDNEWHFVVCTWEGIDESTAKIYVDNVEQTTYLVGTFVIGVTDEPLTLGCRFSSGAPNYFFGGILDNVMIFSKALSVGERSYLWDNGDGRESITTQYPYFVRSEINSLGDYKEDSIIHFSWHTQDSSGSSVTRDPVGTIKVYKDDNTAESTAGITDVKDFGGITGVHNCKIDLSADAFYESGHDYSIVLDCPVLDDESVKVVLASFSIQNRFSASLQKAAKVIVNKAIQNKSTGKIDYYDDDGQTVILTHTPTDGESEIERTPS